MSKLYCEIPVSARRTIPTARAHTVGSVRVKNWTHSVQATIIDRGGGESDSVVVILKDLNTGREYPLVAGTIFAILANHPH